MQKSIEILETAGGFQVVILTLNGRIVVAERMLEDEANTLADLLAERGSNDLALGVDQAIIARTNVKRACEAVLANPFANVEARNLAFSIKKALKLK